MGENQPITTNNTWHNHKPKQERKKKQHRIVPRTDCNSSMSSWGGTKPVPAEAKTTLQVSKSFWTGGFFLCRRRFLLELLLAMVSLGNSQKSLPFLSAKVLSIPIQTHPTKKVFNFPQQHNNAMPKQPLRLKFTKWAPQKTSQKCKTKVPNSQRNKNRENRGRGYSD